MVHPVTCIFLLLPYNEVQVFLDDRHYLSEEIERNFLLWMDTTSDYCTRVKKKQHDQSTERTNDFYQSGNSCDHQVLTSASPNIFAGYKVVFRVQLFL